VAQEDQWPAIDWLIEWKIRFRAAPDAVGELGNFTLSPNSA
jgi:hypothetical protein